MREIGGYAVIRHNVKSRPSSSTESEGVEDGGCAGERGVYGGFSDNTNTIHCQVTSS